jgi:hypothetical protein
MCSQRGFGSKTSVVDPNLKAPGENMPLFMNQSTKVSAEPTYEFSSSRIKCTESPIFVVTFLRYMA